MSRKRGQAFAAGLELCQCGRAQHSLSSLKRHRMLSEVRGSEYFIFPLFVYKLQPYTHETELHLPYTG